MRVVASISGLRCECLKPTRSSKCFVHPSLPFQNPPQYITLFHHFPLQISANRPKLPARERLREDACINERKRVPLMCGFSLKIPESPSLGLLLKYLHLCLDVAARVVLVRLRPVRDVVVHSA